MSQRVVRYEGEGRHRQPVYADEGPSSAAATDPVAMHANGGLPHLRAPAGGAGPVERRQISEAERDARAEAARRVTSFLPTPSARGEVRPAPAEADQGHRRGAAMPAVVEEVERREPPDVPPDPPAAESRDVSLAALLDATKEAVDAWQEVVASEHLIDQARIRWEHARAALDTSYRALDEAPTAVVESGADYADPIPEPPATSSSSTTTTSPSPTSSSRPTSTSSTTATPTVSRQERSSRLSANQQRVLAATVKHGGAIKEVAAELGFKHYQSVTSCLQDIGKKGLLPVDLIPKLPASFARFVGAPS